MIENCFARIARDVSGDMAAANQSLPVPPDDESEELDREFWKHFDLRLAEAERETDGDPSRSA
jgi:hypothetical protein